MRTRRGFLGRLGGAGAGFWLGRRLVGEQVDAETSRFEWIRARARENGLGELISMTSERYCAVGTARLDFLKESLALSEQLATDYLRHFEVRGFPAIEPSERLFLVALRDFRAFTTFLGYDPGPGTGGLYEVGPNYLVLFDNRGADPAGADAALLANSLGLFHEGTHLLNYNTGMLLRGSDVPLMIVEGLAQYGETRRASERTGVGDLNLQRLGVLLNAERDGLAWLPVERLLEDEPFHADETQQMAYAQSWLITYWLMSQRDYQKRFRAYLDVLRTRRDPGSRLEDVRVHLGEPSKLDDDLRRFTRKLARLWPASVQVLPTPGGRGGVSPGPN